MPVPGLSLLRLKHIRGFVSILRYINPPIIIIIQEEKSEAARSSMLDYLGNLMEDASDFSWESAKASHAIVLTNMEADCLQWTETYKLDLIRRAHAKKTWCPRTIQ